MTKTNTKTSTPNLDALCERHRAGAILNIGDVSAAMAADVLDVWNAERNAKREAEATAERASWTDELAVFIADTLAADESGLFPRGTVFHTKSENVTAGVPSVVVSPASKVEHSGGGLTEGKVHLAFHNVDKPNIDRVRLALRPHSTKRVEGGNYDRVLGSVHSVSSEGWVLNEPYIARPSTGLLAQRVAQIITDTMNRNGTDFAASAGASEVVECDGENILMLGHVLVVCRWKEGTTPAHDEIVKAAELAVKHHDAAEFVPGVGKIRSAKVATVETIMLEGKAALGVAFEVEARGRYVTK